MAEHKTEMLEKLGNFSCVLMKMGIFTEEGRNKHSKSFIKILASPGALKMEGGGESIFPPSHAPF